MDISIESLKCAIKSEDLHAYSDDSGPELFMSQSRPIGVQLVVFFCSSIEHHT